MKHKLYRCVLIIWLVLGIALFVCALLTPSKQSGEQTEPIEYFAKPATISEIAPDGWDAPATVDDSIQEILYTNPMEAYNNILYTLCTVYGDDLSGVKCAEWHDEYFDDYPLTVYDVTDGNDLYWLWTDGVYAYMKPIVDGTIE